MTRKNTEGNVPVQVWYTAYGIYVGGMIKIWRKASGRPKWAELWTRDRLDTKQECKPRHAVSLSHIRVSQQYELFRTVAATGEDRIPSPVESCHKGAFTRVPQVDQRGWINQSEPCKQFLSTEVMNGVDGWTSWRWPTFVQRRWFTLGDSPQITRVNKQVTTKTVTSS